MLPVKASITTRSARGNKEKHTPSSATVSLIVLVAVAFFTVRYMKDLNSGIPLYYDSIGYSATVGGTFVAVFTLASTAMRLIGRHLQTRDAA